MTEMTEHFRDDVLDEEDIRLKKAIVSLQEVVTDFLVRTGKSVNELTEDEQQELVDRIDPHLNFEITNSDDIYCGMPIVVRGAGAFLLADQDSALLGSHITLPGDIITGTVRNVRAYPVPSVEIVRTNGQHDSLPTYDQSLSAVIIVEGAQFYTALQGDGSFGVTHNLDTYKLVIPAIYEMDTRVADVSL